MIKQIEMRKKVDEIEVKSVEIALNAKCNLNCKYCGAYSEKDVYLKPRLTVNEIINELDALPSLERVKLSGGEVTIDLEDCIKLGEYCKKRQLFYQINTNGTLISHEDIDNLKKAGLSALHISLNFLDRESYSQYYNVKEALFDKIVSNISYASQHLECVVETLLFDETIDNLVKLSQFISNLGASGYEVQYGISQSGWENGIEQEEVEQAVYNLCRKKPKGLILYFSCFEFPAECIAIEKFKNFLNQDDIYFTNCIEGKLEFHLSDNGDIIGCELADVKKVGNIHNGFSLGDINKISSVEKEKLFDLCNNCRKKFRFR